MNDALKDLPKLGADAMGPCVLCDKQLLEVGPLFYRLKVKRCGIDLNEVRRHVGLAQSIAPGRDGLILADVLGPKVEPVVVMDEWKEVNVCLLCGGDLPMMALIASITEKAAAE